MKDINLVKDSEYELSVQGAKVAVEMLLEDFISDVEKLQKFDQLSNENLLDFTLEEHRLFKKLVSVFDLNSLGTNQIKNIGKELKPGNVSTNEKPNIDLKQETKNNLIKLINKILEKEENITVNVKETNYNSKNPIGENISNEDLADIYVKICKSLKNKYKVNGQNNLQKILESDKCEQLKNCIENDASSIKIKDLDFKEINTFLSGLNYQKKQEQKNKDSVLLKLINNLKQNFKEDEELYSFFVKDLDKENKEKFNDFITKNNYQEDKKIFNEIISIIASKYNIEYNSIIDFFNKFKEIYKSIQEKNDSIVNGLNQRKEDLKEIQKKQIKVPDVKVIYTDKIHNGTEIDKIPNGGRIWYIVSSGDKHMSCICIEKDMEGNVNEIIFDPNKQDMIEFLYKKFNNIDTQHLKQYPKFINKEKLLAHSDCEVWSVYFPFIIERLMSFNKTESALLYDMLGCKKGCKEFSFKDSPLFKQVMLLNALDDERESKKKQVSALYNYDNRCYVSPDERMIDYIKNNNSCPICEYKTKYGKRGEESNFIFRNALRLTNELRTMQKDKVLKYLIRSESRYLFDIDANEFNKLKMYEIINFLYKEGKLDFNSKDNEYLKQILDLLAYKKFEDYDKLNENFKSSLKRYLIEKVKKSVDEPELINNNYKELFILQEQNILDKNDPKELLLKNKIEENVHNIVDFNIIINNEKLIKKLFTKTNDGLYKIEPKQINIFGLSKIIEYSEVQEYLKNIKNLDVIIDNIIGKENLLKFGTLLKKYKLPNENEYLEYIGKIINKYVEGRNNVKSEYEELFKYGFINKNSINEILSYYITNNNYDKYIYWSEQLIQNCIIFSITPNEMESIVKSFNEKIRKEDLITAAEYYVNELINNVKESLGALDSKLSSKDTMNGCKKILSNIKKILSISGINANILNKTNENLLNCLFYMKYNGKSFEEALNYFKDNKKINEEELTLVQAKFEELKESENYQKLEKLMSYTLGKYLLLSNNTSEVSNFFENTFSYIEKEKISDMLVDIRKFKYSLEQLLMWNDDDIITIFLKTESVDKLLETKLDDFIRQIEEFSQTEEGKEIQNSVSSLKDKVIDFDSLELKDELKKVDYLTLRVGLSEKLVFYGMITNKIIDSKSYKSFLNKVVSKIIREKDTLNQENSEKENEQPIKKSVSIIKEIKEAKSEQQGIQFAFEELSGELSRQEGNNKQIQQSFFEYNQNTHSVFLTETSKQKLKNNGINDEDIKNIEEFLDSNFKQNENSFILKDINKNGFRESKGLRLNKERIKIINKCLGFGKGQEVGIGGK